MGINIKTAMSYLFLRHLWSEIPQNFLNIIKSTGSTYSISTLPSKYSVNNDKEHTNQQYYVFCFLPVYKIHQKFSSFSDF